MIKVGTMDIIQIELRYKGSFTAQPQFFAVFTNKFKKLLKPLSLMENKAGKNLHLEHIEDEILNFGVLAVFRNQFYAFTKRYVLWCKS